MSQRVLFSSYWSYFEGKTLSPARVALSTALEVFGEVHWPQVHHRMDRDGDVERELIKGQDGFKGFAAEVQKLMKSRGYPDEDMSLGFNIDLSSIRPGMWMIVDCTQTYLSAYTENVDPASYLSEDSPQGKKSFNQVFDFMKALGENVGLRNLWLIQKGAFVGDPYYLYRPPKLLKAMEYPVLREGTTSMCRDTYAQVESVITREELVNMVVKVR